MSVPTKVLYTIAGFPVDVIKQFNFKYSSKATKHPVEKGADLTDNIVADPVGFTLECVVSDTPTGAIASDPTRKSTNPAKDADAAFVAVWQARLPVVVVTPRGTFTSMAMTEYTVTGNAQTGNALTFTATFENIVIVTNTRTTVRTAVPNGNGTSHLGDKAAQQLVEDVAGSTYVIRVPTNQKERAQNTKLYGVPVGCIDDFELNFDHYRIDISKTRPDGYVTDEGHYHPMAKRTVLAAGGGGDQPNAPTHYDPSDNTYKYPDGSPVTKSTTGPGQYNQMTGKVPRQ